MKPTDHQTPKMRLYLLLWYFFLLADFSRGEVYHSASTTENGTPITLTNEDIPLSTAAMDDIENYIADDDLQTEPGATTLHSTEESADTQDSSTTTLDISTTTSENDPCDGEVPGPVFNVTMEEISHLNISISWLPPSSGNSCVKWYIISWSDTSTTMWTNDTTSELHYTIKDLNPCTEYVISVLVESKTGETSVPMNITVTTASVAPGTVTELTIQNTLPDAINISWRAPSDGSNCVKWYTISWSDISNSIWSDDKTDQLYYTIQSLKPCTEYFVIVAVEGINGETSKPSITMASTSSVVPGPISNLTILDTAPETLNISWLISSYTKNCMKQCVIYWSDPAGVWRNGTTTDLNYTIKDLSPCTDYLVSIVVEGTNGETSSSYNSTITTASIAPGSVTSLKVEDVLTDSLSILWLAPTYGNNCVKFYVIDWRPHGTTTLNSTTTTNLNYTIVDLYPCTEYTVSVIAMGENEEASEPSTLNETTASVVPGQVSNLTVQEITPESINMSWLIPSYGSSCVKRYIIYWSDSADSIWKNATTTDLFYTIKALSPCTNYLVSIVAEGTNGGTSGYYNSTITTASVAPGSVTSLKVEYISTDSLHISWLAPTYGNNCVKFYVIDWKPHGSTTLNNVPTTNLNYTIMDLYPCTEYTVSVTAMGENGEASEPSTLNETTASVVPQPVLNLTIENISSDYLNISWLAPLYGSSCVKWYVVSWNDSIITTEITTELYFTIEDLNPCTNYMISVNAESKHGEISEACNSTATTASVVPGPASSLTIENVTYPDSISISWMAPSYGGSCVNQYIITWSDSSTTLWGNETTSNLYYTIENLTPCTEYGISVVAESYNGETSQPSKLTGTTASVVPGSISNVTIEDILSESIRISWLEPSNSSNCINWYIISWSDNATTMRNETTGLYYIIEDLNPCTEYVISVAARGYDGEESEPSLSIVTTDSAVPGPVSVLSAENITSNFLNISWMVPSFGGNCVKSYDISWCVAFTPECSIGTTRKLYYIIEELIPCTGYTISVIAKGSNDEESEPRTSNETTAPVEPVPVTDLTSGFIVLDERNISVILNWKVSYSLREILVGFLISYEGYDPEVSNSEADKNQFFMEFNYWDINYCCGYLLYNLHPDYDYNVSVSTRIKCDHNHNSESRYTGFRYPAGVPKANDGSLINLKPDPFSTEDPTKQAKLTLYSDFFGEENGRIISYALIVAQTTFQQSPEAGLFNGSKPIMNNWYNATAGEIILPYQATEENWNPFTVSSIRSALHLDVEKTTFTLGTDDCTNPRTYCNGELRPNTNYSVKIRAFTSGGYQDSQLFYFITDSEVSLGMILGILFSIILLGAGGITFFMYRNGILNWPPAMFKKQSALSVPPPPISIKKFPAHCTQMLEIPNKLSNEYQLLATLSADVYSSNTFIAAQNPENKKKNRYVNILPYDSTRVTLEAIDDDPFSDYINASFIKGYSNDIEYIASQGPKEETHVDFWRMILQHNVHLIVMVTNLVENEKVKCYKYYPNLRETFEVRDMTIGCTSEINFPVYTARTFLLNKGERRRLVTQLHFREWPDFGTPDSSHSMLQFVQTVREHAARGVGLTLVHCSAGVGRTGTLIALDILLQRISEHKSLDVFGTVFKLRKQRINMVQTEGQYAYIYKCIKEALEDPALLNKNNSTTNSLEPIYENVGTSLKNLQYERLSQIGIAEETKHI